MFLSGGYSLEALLSSNESSVVKVDLAQAKLGRKVVLVVLDCMLVEDLGIFVIFLDMVYLSYNEVKVAP